MESSTAHPRPTQAAPLSTHARLERISEPWALSRTFAIAATLVLAMLLGTWAASGEFETLILFAVWFAAVMIIVFVQDYWWAPPLVINSLSLTTMALGFPLGGMEIGVVILALTFPVKMAMKTLRKAEPEMNPGGFYWAILGYVVVHAVVILFYNKIDGAPQLRNIVKAYYICLVPLIMYGLLIRYCHFRTVRPTVYVLFFTTFFAVAVSLFTILTGISIEPFSDLRITVGWLDQAGAMFMLRYSGSNLFIGGIAFWPAIRHGPGRLVLAAGIVLGAIGTIAGGGRIPVVICVLAGVFFAAIRGKLWLAIPFLIGGALISATISANPDFYLGLPTLVQRSLAPLNFSYQGAEMNSDLSTSDDWHKDIRDQSIPYWMMDTTSFWVGHGFKSWDPSIKRDDPNAGGADYQHLVDLAIQMGATENMFSSITNIFGFTGLILYGCFLLNLAWMLYRGSRLAPAGSIARALCEFSLVNLFPAIAFCAYYGSIPNQLLNMWVLGILAARPYLTKSQMASPEALMEVPAFARPTFAERFRTG